MPAWSAAETIAALRDAVGALGLTLEAPPPGGDFAGDVALVDPSGRRVLLELKRMALVSAPGLADRIELWNRTRAKSAHTAVRVVVADRVTQESQDILRQAGLGWLDLRGHLRIVGQGFFIDTEVPALRTGHERPEPLHGQVGIEVAVVLLLSPETPAGVRQIASGLGRAPSSVSAALSGLSAHELLDAKRRPVVPELFWELTAHWKPVQAHVGDEPSPGDRAVNDALRLGLDDIEHTTGWALGDNVAAAAYGAPVGIRADQPKDFYVPDQATLRRATHLLGPARELTSRAGTVRVAPVSLVCARRVDGTTWANESWPLAQPLFVALDLAQDPGRGREILSGWTPGGRWHRVW